MRNDTNKSGRPLFRLDYFVVFCSLLGICITTLRPFDFADFDRIYNLVARFDRGTLSISSLFEPLANIALFMPLGLGIGSILFAKKYRHTHVIAYVFLIGGGFSVLVEIAQVFESSRHSTALDVCTNTLGALLGAVLSLVFPRRLMSQAYIWTYKTWAGIGGGYIVLLAVFLTWASVNKELWSIDNWSHVYELSIANEVTGTRPWSGVVTTFFLADQVIPASYADSLLQKEDRLSGARSSIIAFYTLNEARRFTDVQGTLPDLVEQPARILPVQNSATYPLWYKSEQPVTILTRRIQEANAFSVGISLETNDAKQDGPARIFSISEHSTRRNITLEQSQSSLQLRMRTPISGINGDRVIYVLPEFFSGSGRRSLHCVYDGDTIVVYDYTKEETYTVEFNAKKRTIWFFAYLIVGKLTLEFVPENTEFTNYNVLFYGFLYIPLGILAQLMVYAKNFNYKQRLVRLFFSVGIPVVGIEFVLNRAATLHVVDLVTGLVATSVGLVIGAVIYQIQHRS